MKEHLKEHIEILKTDPEIKKNAEELKFWCNVSVVCYEKGRNKNWWSELIKKWISNWYMSSDKEYAHINWFQRVNIHKDNLDDNSMSFDMSDYWDKFYSIKKIIWQIHEWHLRMFFDHHANNYECAPCPKIYSDWWLDFDELWIIPAKLDNTKPYMEQSESFFKKLNEWLVSEFNIKVK